MSRKTLISLGNEHGNKYHIKNSLNVYLEYCLYPCNVMCSLQDLLIEEFAVC